MTEGQAMLQEIVNGWIRQSQAENGKIESWLYHKDPLYLYHAVVTAPK